MERLHVAASVDCVCVCGGGGVRGRGGGGNATRRYPRATVPEEKGEAKRTGTYNRLHDYQLNRKLSRLSL